MRIAVIGATGMAGSRIAAEAAGRGHSVSGFSRSDSTVTASLPGLTLFTADAADPESMGRLAAGHDVIVLATRPVPGTEDNIITPLTTVLDAARHAGRRVIVIGGAGPLLSPDHSDRLVIDDERFVPRQWRTIAQASVDQFNACTTNQADWTYLSPPALFESGTRTGTYRRGENRLLIDVEGVSRISAEDFAIATVDEIENADSDRRHFTVAY
ncbi:NAD(P)-dependent oxidoreductase [Arthrobacter sp. H14]|uniref:NAD(P)-dependent oxidoreductase n=1 Tax=Arthrobacter sp. H14 TaxID=1312959 RepID=UPI00047EC966|nr:NAD(P)H-binding protein [Arthrobacter sp. H14]